jgi:hypothetical protein
LPCETTGTHFQIDVRTLLQWDFTWDLMIAHPPCQYLTNSGVRWLYSEPGRWKKMIEAGEFFNELLNTQCQRVAIENPIPHKYALKHMGRKYDQIVQPWMFGHGETKATCLWLKNLPKLEPTEIVDGRKARVHLEPPGPNRWKNRSRTMQGIATAMAAQWG